AIGTRPDARRAGAAGSSRPRRPRGRPAHRPGLRRRRRGDPAAMTDPIPMRAVATEFGGITFRSRLEATWAAFFTELGWPWVYEPVALRGSLPDFILRFPPKPVLVEVKPIATITLEAYTQHGARIEQSGWLSGALILGLEPLWPRTRADEHVTIGAL